MSRAEYGDLTGCLLGNSFDSSRVEERNVRIDVYECVPLERDVKVQAKQSLARQKQGVRFDCEILILRLYRCRVLLPADPFF